MLHPYCIIVDGVKVAEALEGQLRDYMGKISSGMVLSAEGIEDGLPVALMNLVELFDDNGNLEVDLDEASKVVALDLQAVGVRIDEAIGKVSILRFTGSMIWTPPLAVSAP